MNHQSDSHKHRYRSPRTSFAGDDYSSPIRSRTYRERSWSRRREDSSTRHHSRSRYSRSPYYDSDRDRGRRSHHDRGRNSSRSRSRSPRRNRSSSYSTSDTGSSSSRSSSSSSGYSAGSSSSRGRRKKDEVNDWRSTRDGRRSRSRRRRSSTESDRSRSPRRRRSAGSPRAGDQNGNSSNADTKSPPKPRNDLNEGGRTSDIPKTSNSNTTEKMDLDSSITKAHANHAPAPSLSHVLPPLSLPNTVKDLIQVLDQVSGSSSLLTPTSTPLLQTTSSELQKDSSNHQMPSGMDNTANSGYNHSPHSSSASANDRTDHQHNAIVSHLFEQKESSKERSQNESEPSNLSFKLGDAVPSRRTSFPLPKKPSHLVSNSVEPSAKKLGSSVSAHAFFSPPKKAETTNSAQTVLRESKPLEKRQQNKPTKPESSEKRAKTENGILSSTKALQPTETPINQNPLHSSTSNAGTRTSSDLPAASGLPLTQFATVPRYDPRLELMVTSQWGSSDLLSLAIHGRNGTVEGLYEELCEDDIEEEGIDHRNFAKAGLGARHFRW
ncbi:hypothetical protein BJ742DRAFT_141714 [Cladochytrium replicatum]|nr:hypothetical protein BJ742DRAFT_141714 [Cladochytrium replicatum]